MKRVWITVALAGVCLFFTAAAPVEQNFARGETLDYTLEWVHITGGKARMTIAVGRIAMSGRSSRKAT